MLDSSAKVKPYGVEFTWTTTTRFSTLSKARRQIRLQFINRGFAWGNKLPNPIDYLLLMQLAHTLLFMYLFILAHSNFLGVYFVLLVFLRIETFLLPLQTPGVVQCTEFMDGTSELM